MATSLATLVERTRRFVRDWPQEDVLTASLSSTSTTITVADGTLYADNWLIEIDQETLFVNGNGTGTSATVRRGVRGSTAASHVSGATVLLRPMFSYMEIVDALNWAKDECFPLIYKEVLDTSLTTSANTFEYTVPNLDSLPVRYISKLELKASGESDYREFRGWSIRRGATPKIQFTVDPDPSATIRLHGYSPFPDLTTGTSLDAQWPINADKLLPLGAASYLLASEESGRGRGDRPARQAEGEALRAGARMSAANSLDARFRRGLANAAMPPLPKHLRPTF
jgi:hypothetical protein